MEKTKSEATSEISKRVLQMQSDTVLKKRNWRALKDHGPLENTVKNAILAELGEGRFYETSAFFFEDENGYIALIQFEGFQQATIPLLYLVSVPSADLTGAECINIKSCAQRELVRLRNFIAPTLYNDSTLSDVDVFRGSLRDAVRRPFKRRTVTALQEDSERNLVLHP